MSVVEIEKAIARLPAADVRTLAEWFTEFQEQLWDKQIEDDTKGGRLNYLISQADQQISEGKVRSI